MTRFEAYRELRSLTLEAVAAMGEHRAALVAGCHHTTIQTWLRRSNASLATTTIDLVLPRMRRWQRWLPGYLAGWDEFRRLMEAAPLPPKAIQAELADLLEQALQRYTPVQVALGCDVTDGLINNWRAGIFREHRQHDLLQALAHLRHMDNWPQHRKTVPRARTA